MPINLKLGSEFDEASARKAVAEAKAYYKKQLVAVRVGGEFHEVSARKAVADARRYYAQQVVSVKVGGEFNEVSARKAVADANRYYAQQDVKVKVGSDFNEVSARSAMVAARRYYAQQSVTINVNSNFSQTNAALNRTNTVLNRVSQPRTVQFGANTMGFDRGILGILQRLNQIGAATRFSARGLGTMFAPVVGLALIDIAKGAVTASQSIALLPAVATSAGAAFGTLKLATLGFGDAMDNIGDPEKFATALQSLSPNAQQAALSIQNLLPQFKELQRVTQDAFFADFGQELNRLTTEYLPGIQKMTTTIADSFNQMVKGISDELMLPGTQAAMQETLSNIGSAFETLAPAARELVSAFINLTATGSSFLPDLASAAADAAASFAQFISDARESGKLQEFIQNGIDAVSTLADGIWNLGGTIYQIFGSDGKKNVEDFGDTLEGINTVVATLGGNFDNLSADLQEEFGLMTGQAAVLRDWIMDIPEALNVAMTAGIDFANTLKDAMLNGPVKAFNVVIQKITEILNLLPGPDRPLDFGKIPEIPNIPYPPGVGPDSKIWGDWAPYRQNPEGNVAPGSPGKYRDRYGHERDVPTPGGGGGGRYPGPFNVPAPPPEKGSGSGADKTPFVDPSKYMMGDPLAGAPPAIPGADPQKIYDADSKVITAQHNLEQGRLALQVLQEKGNATQQQLLTAKNNIEEQERALYDAQADDIKARTTQMKQATSDLKDVFAPLDKDFGISGGIPGLVENLVKMFGNMALAGAIGSSPSMQAALLSSGGSGFGVGGGGGGGFGGGGGGFNAVGMPSILKDTGSNPSGPQSRQAAALIQQMFGDQIRGQIGGSRDNNTVKGTHDTGTSIDIPIGSDQGALGDRIRDYLQAHAQELGLKYTIWRDQGKYPGGGGFTTPGHQDHIDAHFDGQGLPGQAALSSPGSSQGAMDFSSFGTPGSKQSIANMVYQQALSRGYSPHEAQSILAYAIGESGLNAGSAPGAQGGTGAANEVQGLFQQKPAFAQGGGISPDQRKDPVANTTAYLNQLERYRNLPIEQALPATSVGGPLAAGGYQPWFPLMDQARGYIASGGGGGGPGMGMPTGLGMGMPTGPGMGMPTGPGMGMPTGLGMGGPPMSPNIGPGPLQLGVGSGAIPGGLGAASQMPGPGAGAAAGQGVQGHAAGEGGWQPAGGGFGGVAALSAAGDAAGMAADAFAPGSGEAVKMGIKLANRAIGFGGQAAAIGVQALGETFLPAGSEFADPLKSWPGRIAGGFAGAKPSTENKAGQTMPPAKPQNDVDPNTKEHGKGKGQPPGPAIGTVNFSSPVQDQQSMVRDIDRQTNAHGAGSGR